MVRRERVDVDQADDGVVAGGRLGHDHPAVGVGDEQDRCPDRRDDVTHVGGVAGEVAQRVGDGDDAAVVTVVAGDDDRAWRWSRSITGFQLADSAKAPWTRTMVGWFSDMDCCFLWKGRFNGR